MNQNKIEEMAEEKELRQTRLNLRLSNNEYELVKSRAEAFGLPMAKFVRVSLVDLPKPAKRIHDLPVVDPTLLRQLVGIGNNVNQLTRYAHIVSNDAKQTLNVLELAFALQKIANELQQLREQYSLNAVENADNIISDSTVINDQTGSPVIKNFAETIKC